MCMTQNAKKWPRSWLTGPSLSEGGKPFFRAGAYYRRLWRFQDKPTSRSLALAFAGPTYPVSAFGTLAADSACEQACSISCHFLRRAPNLSVPPGHYLQLPQQM
jgi:hypothetical protein